MRKMMFAATAMLLVATVLAGCGDDDGAATTSVPQATEAPTTTEAPLVTEAPTTTEAAATTQTVPTTEAIAPTETTAEPTVEFSLSSPVFDDGGDIPIEFTCDGANDSPELVFAGVPGGTTSLALAVLDPDGGDWIHWIAWNLPPESTGLPMNVPAGDLADGTRQGENDFAQVFAAGEQFPGGGTIRIDGWDGPCPGPQPHRYFFTLYALTGTIDLPSGTPGLDVLAAIEDARHNGSLIGETSILGIYPAG